MTFVIGWSGVSYAFANSSHLQMQFDQMGIISSVENQNKTEDPYAMHHGNECNDLAQSSGHATYHEMQASMDDPAAAMKMAHHQDTSQHMMDMSHCQQNTTQNATATDGQLNHQLHVKCQDCAQIHCQSLSSDVHHHVLNLTQPLMIANRNIGHSVYNAQHLSGYWQEILRPPRA